MTKGGEINQYSEKNEETERESNEARKRERARDIWWLVVCRLFCLAASS